MEEEEDLGLQSLAISKCQKTKRISWKFHVEVDELSWQEEFAHIFSHLCFLRILI